MQPWGQLSKGAEPKPDQKLCSSGVYAGKESGSLNMSSATEIPRLKQNKLGLVDERGRDITEVQVCV